MNQRSIKSLSAMLGTAFSVSLVSTAIAEPNQNPFSITEASPLLVAAAAQGQCGQAKCGANAKPVVKTGEAKCGADKAQPAEAKCGAEKKVMEAKCGADKGVAPAPVEAKCGANK